MSDSDLERQLSALKREYADRLKVHVESLRQSWTTRVPGDEVGVLNQIQQGAHRLAGSAGTFGFPTVSDAAIHLEDYVEGLARAGKPPGSTEQDAINNLLERLATAVSDGNG